MAQPYYEALGLSCDALLRCKDCRRFVPADALRQTGCCSCGCKRVVEITTLSLWEWLRLRLGLIDFAHRRAFLAEFSTRKKVVQAHE